jgi:CubicO group peptidase (beta-lactamase class C family)
MRMTTLRPALISTITFGVVALAAAQISGDVPNAKKIQDYVTAFNAGEPQMAEFLRNNAALQQRSLEDRLAAYRQVSARLKSLEVRSVSTVKVGAQEMSVTVEAATGSGGKVSVTFNFEPQLPNKLVSLRFEDAGGPGEQAAGPPLAQAEFAKKVAALMDERAAKDEFSGVVLVTHKGKTVFEKAYGLADKEKNIPNNLNTKFNLGSINKIFTRVAIEQLARQGTLSLDDKLGKFLPDYPNHDAANKVTVSELLNMTSGITDFFGDRYESADKAKLKTLADYLPLFADEPLLFEPGTDHQYSNGGYLVLGLIVQKVSGEDYYEYVKQHIFQPAGMKDTDSYSQDQVVPNRAEGYIRQGSDWKNNRSTRPARGSSAGGGYSTAHDLLRFSIAFTNGDFNNSANKDVPRREQPFGVAGGAPGMNTNLFFDPKSQSAIILLSNYDRRLRRDLLRPSSSGCVA